MELRNKMKNILVGINHLHSIGGSETYTYTLMKELITQHYNVSLLVGSNMYGIMSEKIKKDFGITPINFNIKEEIRNFDASFISHNSTIWKLLLHRNKIKCKTIFQICHGIYPALEQPYGEPIRNYFSITEEVREHLNKKEISSHMVRNGVDTKRFSQTKSNKNLKNVLSLSQSTKFNSFLEEICKKNNWNFKSFNKHINPIFNIEDLIKESDLVVSLGRGVYEGMSCGKNVLVADWRDYQHFHGPIMDGLVTEENIKTLLFNNCSGRAKKIPINEKNITDEMKKYSIKNCDFNNNFVLKNLNIENQVKKMLSIADKYKG